MHLFQETLQRISLKLRWENKMSKLQAEGMELAPGVIETIISVTVKDVEGVASVGSYVASGFRSVFTDRPSSQGVTVELDDNDALIIEVHVDAYYGFCLPDVAVEIRKAVSTAISVQVGMKVAMVNVYFDGVQFVS